MLWKRKRKKNNLYYTPIRTSKFRTLKTPRAVIHCGRESNMIYPLWKTIHQFLPELNMPLLYNPAIMFLGTYPKELKAYVYIKPSHRCL